MHNTDAALTPKPLAQKSIAHQGKLSTRKRFGRLIFKCDDAFPSMQRSSLLFAWGGGARRDSCAADKHNDCSVLRSCNLCDECVDQFICKWGWANAHHTTCS